MRHDPARQYCSAVPPATSLNGRAQALVTLNTADFEAAGRFGMPVLTPGAFLQQLRRSIPKE